MNHRTILPLGLLTAALLLSGCRAVEEPENEPVSPMSSSQLNQQTAEYITLIRELDFLLGGEDWQDPREIDPTYLTMWYASYLQLHNDRNEHYLSGYLREGEDRAFFPAEEVERVLKERFGLDQDTLRQDNHTYRPDEQVYATVGPAGDLRSYDIDLISAVREEGQLILTFQVSSGSDLSGVRRTLTLTDTEPPVYLSLTTP